MVIDSETVQYCTCGLEIMIMMSLGSDRGAGAGVRMMRRILRLVIARGVGGSDVFESALQRTDCH